MSNRYESQDKLLIISPTSEDFNELKVKFTEQDAKVIYLAQVKSLDELNDYDTYVFYHKNNQSHIFYEYENPEHQSYSAETKIGTFEEFWKKLAEIDKHAEEPFFKTSSVDFNYKELDSLIEINTQVQPKKQKI